MHPFTTTTAFGLLGSFVLLALALLAADPATPSFIVDPAAVTAAPAVPDSGKHVVSDIATDGSTGEATVLTASPSTSTLAARPRLDAPRNLPSRPREVSMPRPS